MLMSLLAWPITLLGLVFMLPWARWLLRRSDMVLLIMTTLALSIGTLSLIMLWIGLLGQPINWKVAALIGAVISFAGWIVQRRSAPEAAHLDNPPSRLRGLALGAVILITLMSVLIVFNAVYWPLGIDDALAIYGWYGKTIAFTGLLPHGPLYENYPMLIPLSYAFTHQAAGWANEHLAALIPAVLSVGVLGVAYELGSALYRRVVGLIAALLIALTPLFAYWASASYTDLPAAFFYGLAALFLIRADQNQVRRESWRDALLAGIMAGLAAWTKNSALLIVGSFGLWVIYGMWRARSILKGADFRNIGLNVIGFLGVCGPWYAHTLLSAGLIVPPTGWTYAAQRTFTTLFPYLTDTRYLWIGWLFTAGLLFALWQSVRSGGKTLAPTFLAVIFYLPFFAIWWALFSYDSRFLLVLSPFVAVMAANLIQTVIERYNLITLIHHQPRHTAILIGVLALLTLPAVSSAIMFKPELLRHPLMSDADKHRLRLGSRYDVALYLQTLPHRSRIWSQDILLPYPAYPAQITVGTWPTITDLQGYDYWVLSPGETLPPGFMNNDPVYIAGGYRVYKIDLRDF